MNNAIQPIEQEDSEKQLHYADERFNRARIVHTCANTTTAVLKATFKSIVNFDADPTAEVTEESSFKTIGEVVAKQTSEFVN